jgi:hypothetical protein
MRKNVSINPQKGVSLSNSVKIEPLSNPIIYEQVPSSKEKILATVILESVHDDQYDTEQRFQTLKSVVSYLTTNHLNNGIIVFPAGMFFTRENPPSSFYSRIENEICSFLATIENNVIICFGIDGSEDREGYARDQIAVALDKKGIIALGRKFYPQKKERGHVNLAKHFNIPEEGKSRIFRFGDSSYYLAMCYDSFGIKKQNIKNPGVHGLIELAHCFYMRGQGPSGESYFARHGFAGAARHWNCPVFGTGVFFGRSVPESWPTGVVWNQGIISTTNWNYGMNPLKPRKIMRLKVDDGAAVIRLFSI